MLSFTTPVSYDVGAAQLDVVTADFNNDTRLDLAFATLGNSSVSVLLGNGDGTFDTAITSDAGDLPKSIAVGDFNGDGKLDLVAVTSYSFSYDGDPTTYDEDLSNGLSVMLGNGDGSFQVPGNVKLDHGAKARSVAVGDFNEDGMMDVAVASDFDYAYPGDVYLDFGQAKVLLSIGDGSFSAAGTFWHYYPINSAVVADFDGDDHQDFVVGSYYTDLDDPSPFPLPKEAVRLLKGDGQGNLAEIREVNWIIDHGTSMAAGNVNFEVDADVDLVTADGNDVNVRLGDGAGGFESPPGGYSYVAGENPTSVVLSDFNRDGKLDIVTANSLNDDVSMLRGRGDGTFADAEYFAVSPGTSSVVSGDFNGDGLVDKADYVVWRKNGGTSDQYDLWRASYGQSVAPVSFYPIAVVTGDFNGDGWLDLATASSNGTNASVLLNDQSWPQLPPVSLSVSDATVIEGNTAAANATFTVTLSKAAAVDVTVHYSTVNGTAVAGSDYTANTGTVIIPAGQTSRTFTVPVIGDRVAEPDEFFFVRLSSPTNATIADRDGEGRILDDEPRISFGDVTVTEGNTGTLNATFTVKLSALSAADVTVHYDTADSSALAGSDYMAASEDLVIPAGQTSRTFTVAVVGDRLFEMTESFSVFLSAPTNAIILDGYAYATILDNEPRISISDVSKSEGKGNKTTLFTFTVTLSAPYDQAVTMSYRTMDGTATTADSDYIAKTGTLVFAPGETTKTITIEVKADGKKEVDEKFSLDLFDNSINSQFTKFHGIATILNDDR